MRVVYPPFLFMKTKRGIYHNLHESEYRTTVAGITFVFSSNFYLGKFTDEYKEEIERFNQSINKVYKNKFNINAELLALIRLYSNIEKRGFLIYIQGREVQCQDHLEYVLQVRTEKN